MSDSSSVQANYSELKFTREQGFFDKSLTVCWSIAIFFGLTLFIVFHFREFAVEFLKFNSIAPRNLSMVDLDLYDEEAAKMQPKRDVNVLIVGGAGYIGSHVNQLLQEKGYRTVVFDNLSRGSKNNVIGGDFIQGDLGNSDDLAKLFNQNHFDAVMHFAALTDVGESFNAPGSYYNENVVNSLNLLNAVLQNGIKTFVFSSSAAIFGLPQTALIAEDHPSLPINPYGRTKLIFEMILADYDTAYGIKSCCLRYFNACGNDPKNKIKSLFGLQKNLIPLIFQSLEDQSPLYIFGTDYPTKDGTCIRDYIHVVDLAEAHVLGLEKVLSESKSCSYNLGNGQGYSVKEVISTIENCTGLSVNVIEGQRRPGDPPILLADTAKAREELGWSPKYSDLKTMIDHAWKNFKLTQVQ